MTTESKSEERFKRPGDIEILRLTIHKNGSEGISLTNFMVEMSLFEDLFSPTMSATIMLADSIAFSSIFPIIGGEEISIIIKTPEMPDDAAIKKKMIVYKVESKIIQTAKSIYFLHLVSEFAYKDNHVRLMRAFRGNAINSIRGILQNDLKVDLTLLPFNYLEDEKSKNEVAYIAPNVSPIAAINKLTSLCIDDQTVLTDGNAANYLFYENRNGLNLYPLSALTKKKNNGNDTYYYDQNPNRLKDGNRDYIAEMRQIHIFRVDQQFDMLENLSTGIYKNQVIEFDVLSKVVKYNTPYDYMKSFDSTKSMNGFPLSNFYDFIGDGKIVSHSTYHKGVSPIDSTINPVKNRVSLGIMNSVQIEIEVWGRTDLCVGQQLTIVVPAAKNPEANNQKSVMDQLLSGNYLITAIQHRFDSASHKMVIGLSTDSYRN